MTKSVKVQTNRRNRSQAEGGNKMITESVHKGRPEVGTSSDPTNIMFYPPVWRTVLMRTRKHVWAYVALCDPCPNADHEDDREFILDAVDEEIEKLPREGLEIENGYRDKYEDAIVSLLINGASTWLSHLTTACREHVKKYPEISLSYLGPEDFEENPLRKRREISANVDMMLMDGSYVRATLGMIGDQIDYTPSFDHPIFVEFIVAEFYEGKDKAASLYPELFFPVIPAHVLALAAILFYHCIDEYSNGYHHEMEFSPAAYFSMYDAILSTIEKLEKDECRGKIFLENRRKWAQRGRAYWQ